MPLYDPSQISMVGGKEPPRYRGTINQRHRCGNETNLGSGRGTVDEIVIGVSHPEGGGGAEKEREGHWLDCSDATNMADI